MLRSSKTKARGQFVASEISRICSELFRIQTRLEVEYSQPFELAQNVDLNNAQVVMDSLLLADYDAAIRRPAPDWNQLLCIFTGIVAQRLVISERHALVMKLLSSRKPHQELDDLLKLQTELRHNLKLAKTMRKETVVVCAWNFPDIVLFREDRELVRSTTAIWKDYGWKDARMDVLHWVARNRKYLAADSDFYQRALADWKLPRNLGFLEGDGQLFADRFSGHFSAFRMAKMQGTPVVSLSSPFVSLWQNASIADLLDIRSRHNSHYFQMGQYSYRPGENLLWYRVYEPCIEVDPHESEQSTRSRFKSKTPHQPGSRPTEITRSDVDDWRRRCELVLANKHAQLVDFPEPPARQCSRPSCVASEATRAIKGSCACAIKQAFRMVEGLNPAKERLVWHPNKFCVKTENSLWQEKATEVFKVIQGLFESST